MRRHLLIASLVLFGNVALAKDDSLAILDAAGVKGGLVVHLHCGDGRRTAAHCFAGPAQ